LIIRYDLNRDIYGININGAILNSTLKPLCLYL